MPSSSARRSSIDVDQWNDAVERVVAELLNETVSIQAATEALLAEASRPAPEEVNTLTDRLERAQNEALLDLAQASRTGAGPGARGRRSIPTGRAPGFEPVRRS